MHFRDSEHLRSIFKESPIINDHEPIFFIRNRDVKDGKEIISQREKIQPTYSIHFLSPEPLVVNGRFKTHLKIIIPKNAFFNGQVFSIPYQDNFEYEISSFTQAMYLANALDSFNEQLLKVRTNEAFSFLYKSPKDNTIYSELYPTPPNPFGHGIVMALNPVRKYKKKKFIAAEKNDYLIYLSHSISENNSLKKTYPNTGQAINFIDSNCIDTGIYYTNALCLRTIKVTHPKPFMVNLGS